MNGVYAALLKKYHQDLLDAKCVLKCAGDERSVYLGRDIHTYITKYTPFYPIIIRDVTDVRLWKCKHVPVLGTTTITLSAPMERGQREDGFCDKSDSSDDDSLVHDFYEQATDGHVSYVG